MTDVRKLLLVTVRLRQPSRAAWPAPGHHNQSCAGSLVREPAMNILPSARSRPMSSDRPGRRGRPGATPRFIIMRANETFDGQERVMSRAAYDLQVRATSHSASCGHPGFVPTITSSTWTASASRPRSPRRSYAPSARGSESAAATASWTGKPSKYALTWYASAQARRAGPRRRPGTPGRSRPRWPSRWWSLPAGSVRWRRCWMAAVRGCCCTSMLYRCCFCPLDANGFQERRWFAVGWRCYLGLQHRGLLRYSRSSRAYPARPADALPSVCR